MLGFYFLLSAYTERISYISTMKMLEREKFFLSQQRAFVRGEKSVFLASDDYENQLVSIQQPHAW